MKTAAQIFKALGDETRLRIMALLLDGGELCVCDIMAALALPQSTVSRHLSYLRNAGLVDDRRQGVWMYYTISRGKNEHAGPLHSLLGSMTAGNTRISRDRQVLREHLAEKEKSACR